MKQNWLVAEKIHSYFGQALLGQAGSTGWAAGSAARINAANTLDRALTERQLLPTVSHPGVQHEVVIDAASVSEKGLGKGKPPVGNERMAANFLGLVSDSCACF